MPPAGVLGGVAIPVVLLRVQLDQSANSPDFDAPPPPAWPNLAASTPFQRSASSLESNPVVVLLGKPH